MEPRPAKNEAAAKIEPRELTRLLNLWSAGDSDSGNNALETLETDLRKRAAALLRGERRGHTLQPTALVNEAFVRLVDPRGADWQSRAHFLAVASRVMRRVLIDHARRHRAEKRGGGATPLPLEDELVPRMLGEPARMLALGDALEALESAHPRPHRAIEMKYFGGMKLNEIAAVLEISLATVKTDLHLARAWLYRQLRGGEPRGDDGAAPDRGWSGDVSKGAGQASNGAGLERRADRLTRTRRQSPAPSGTRSR